MHPTPWRPPNQDDIPPFNTCRGRILQDLAKLQQLDGQKVTSEERRESGFVVSSDSGSDDGEDEVLDDEDFEEEEVETAREKLEQFELSGESGNRGINLNIFLSDTLHPLFREICFHHSA